MSTVSKRVALSAKHAKLALFALFGLGFLALAVPAFAEPMTFWTGIVLGDYLYPTHELHHFVLGGVLGLLLLGVLVQAIRPTKRVGALHSAIIIWLSTTVVFSAGGEFSPILLVLLGLLLGMAVVHPAGATQLPSREQLDTRMAALAAVTALAMIALAGVELNSHLTRSDAHVGFDHYLFMAITGVSIAGLVVYGSFRGVGWRFPIYAAAFLLVVIGLGSVVYPGSEQGSSLGVALGLVTVLWALLLVVVAERGDELVGRLGG